MTSFYFKMPLAKSLSYAFARVTRADVLCTNIAVRSGVTRPETQRSFLRAMDHRYSFVWYEARPLAQDPSLYSIERCSYSRNHWSAVGGERAYDQRRYRREQLSLKNGVYFSRYEAIAQLKVLEQKMLQKDGYQAVGNTPASMKALSVHKAPFYGR